MLDMRCQTGIACLIGITLLLFSAVGVAARSYSFPKAENASITRIVHSETFRIFTTDDNSEQVGSGFVIDGEEGLILTAAHVVAGIRGFAWISFAGSNERHRTKILLPKSADTAPQTGKFDISIMKLELPVENVRSLELQFDEIDTEKQHRLTGFGRSNPEPVEGAVQPSKTDECTYTLRSQTLYGDSGSAIVTEEGLVDGIAVDGAESGGTSS